VVLLAPLPLGNEEEETIALVMIMDLAIMGLLHLGPLAVAAVTAVIEVTEVVTVTDMDRMAVTARHLAHQPLGNINLHHLHLHLLP
jgi:hypothetical protein